MGPETSFPTLHKLSSMWFNLCKVGKGVSGEYSTGFELGGLS